MQRTAQFSLTVAVTWHSVRERDRVEKQIGTVALVSKCSRIVSRHQQECNTYDIRNVLTSSPRFAQVTCCKQSVTCFCNNNVARSSIFICVYSCYSTLCTQRNAVEGCVVQSPWRQCGTFGVTGELNNQPNTTGSSGHTASSRAEYVKVTLILSGLG